jgi:hypothetical protein
MPRVSKIATMPEEFRAWLRRALIDRGYGDIKAVCAELNAMLKESGHEATVGKSAVGEEAKRLKELAENVRATTEAAASIAEAARDDGDVRSEALMATIQTDVWGALLEMRGASKIADPAERMKTLTKVAKSIGEMSRARVNQSRWNQVVRERAKDVADKTAKALRKSGMPSALINDIRASILGIAAQQAAPAARAAAAVPAEVSV